MTFTSPETSAETTRLAVLAAAVPLSGTHTLEALTPEALCATAGCSMDEYRAAWPDPTGFQRDLITRLLDAVRDSVAKTTMGMGAGLPRLKLSIETYLEANLARHALRELVLRLRTDTAGSIIVRSRISGFALMLEMELKALRWPHAKASARLLTAAIVEIAQAEHESGRASPELRASVFRYLDSRAS